MPMRYPEEFHRKVLDLVATRRPIAQVATDLNIRDQTIYGSVMTESFWGRMQTELLNRKRWKRASNSPMRYSTTWRLCTIANGVTPPWGCALR